MAGGPFNPLGQNSSQASFLEELLKSFPEWAASQGVEPPMPSLRDEKLMGIPLNTIGQPPGTPPMVGGKLDVVPDAGSAISLPSGGDLNMSKDQSRVVGTETTVADGRGNVQKPFRNYSEPIGPQLEDWVQLIQGEKESGGLPPPQASIPGVPQSTVQQDTIPPPVDPVMQMPGAPAPELADATVPQSPGSIFGKALGMIESMAPPPMPTPAAPAPPPIRPMDSKLMEVLAMGLRPGAAGAGQLSPFFNLLGKG